MENKRNGAQVGMVAKETYEAKVGLEALSRAGSCPQLKGHVHEVMFKDAFNADPMNILQGKTAHLTQSNTAQVKDIIIKQGNKIAGHMQLKDTISSSGVKKTIDQINSGHYSKTAIYGTEETVAKIGNRVGQNVKSSGISSQTTSRIADKALGKFPGGEALGMAAKSGGVSGAVLGAGIEAVCSAKDVFDGNKTVGEAAGDIAVAGIKGGVIGAASTMASTAAAGATGALVSTAAATTIGSAIAATTVGAAAVAAAPVVAGFAVACAVGSFFGGLFSD